MNEKYTTDCNERLTMFEIVHDEEATYNLFETSLARVADMLWGIGEITTGVTKGVT